MKRRQFLSLISAATTAPLLPAPVFAKAAGAAPFSAASVHAAIYHAQSRAVFSVWGLAKAGNMTVAQAAAVMEHLAERGILGPLQGTTFGGRWASSRVMQTDVLARMKAAREAREAAQQVANETPKLGFEVDLTKLMARLRTLQARYESQRPVQAA